MFLSSFKDAAICLAPSAPILFCLNKFQLKSVKIFIQKNVKNRDAIKLKRLLKVKFNESDYSKLSFNEVMFLSYFKDSPIFLAPSSPIPLPLIKYQLNSVKY